MSIIKIAQSEIKGEICSPPSKSAAHRALILASASDGISEISNVELSDDILATLDVIRGCGVYIQIAYEKNEFGYDERVKVRVIGSLDAYKTYRNHEFNFNESGSTMRFMIPFILMEESGRKKYLQGSESLSKRPITIYKDIFREGNGQDVKLKLIEDRTLPMEITGTIKPGIFKIKSNESSQYVSALLMSLPLLNGDSEIIIDTKMESNDYIRMTEQLLNEFKAEIKNTERGYKIKGNQKYIARDVKVEGDFSNAAPFILLNLSVFNNDISIKGLNKESMQGDKRIYDIYDYMEESIKVGKNIDLDLRENVDLALFISVVLPFINGRHRLSGLKRLKLKESNRIESMEYILSKMNINYQVSDDDIIIDGKSSNIEHVRRIFSGEPAVFESRSDHRVVMACAMIGFICGNVIIKNAEAVKKSYPSFFKEASKLGGLIYELSNW